MAVLLSKLTSKAQTVIPREIRARLDLKPGDVVRYRLTDAGIVIDKLPQQSDEDALASFSEWTSATDDEAYGGL
jgi:antitoxin PrlF